MTNGNDIIEFIENSHGAIFEAYCESQGIDLDVLSDIDIAKIECSDEFMEFATRAFSEQHH